MKGFVAWPHLWKATKMADHKVEESPTKLLEEKRESEGLNPYFGVPKMHSLSAFTELVQYLCLMYRELRPKGCDCW